MKSSFYLLAAALCMGMAVPTQGHISTGRFAEHSDDIVPDENYVEDDTIAVDDSDSDWAISDDPTDSMTAEDTYNDLGELCPQNYELLGEFNQKTAEYSFSNPKDANRGITFDVLIYNPVGTKKTDGYTEMVSRILKGTAYAPETEPDWVTKDIDDMLEYKWKLLKAGYISDTSDELLLDYSYRTTITPAWQWKSNGKLTTYHIEDEVYTGGAHGMNYSYCFTIGGPEERLLGLTDIFKEESLPEVFRLIGQKLKERPNALENSDTWKPVAELDVSAEAEGYGVRTMQHVRFGDNWYPRPALTDCGVLFTYFPYEKDCFAAGNIHILLPYDEVADYLLIKP